MILKDCRLRQSFFPPVSGFAAVRDDYVMLCSHMTTVSEYNLLKILLNDKIYKSVFNKRKIRRLVL